MKQIGIAMLLIGCVLAGYGLAVGAVPQVPVLPLDHEYVRLALFAIGMVLLSLGLALTLAPGEPE